MHRKTFLTVVGTLGLVIGLVALGFPTVLLAGKGVQPEPAPSVWVREVGILILALSAILLLIRDQPDTPAMRAVLWGNAIAHGGLLPIEIVAWHAGSSRGSTASCRTLFSTCWLPSASSSSHGESPQRRRDRLGLWVDGKAVNSTNSPGGLKVGQRATAGREGRDTGNGVCGVPGRRAFASTHSIGMADLNRAATRQCPPGAGAIGHRRQDATVNA